MPYIGFLYAGYLNVGQQPLLETGLQIWWRNNFKIILTAVVILVFLVFTLIVYVFLMFLSYEFCDRHVAQGYKSHLWQDGCLQPWQWTLLSSRQDTWSTLRSAPEPPQVSAQHITVKHFQFWIILTCQAENWRFRSSFLIWSDAAVSGTAASVRTGAITDLALCPVLVSSHTAAKTFQCLHLHAAVLDFFPLYCY